MKTINKIIITLLIMTIIFSLIGGILISIDIKEYKTYEKKIVLEKEFELNEIETIDLDLYSENVRIIYNKENEKLKVKYIGLLSTDNNESDYEIESEIKFDEIKIFKKNIKNNNFNQDTIFDIGNGNFFSESELIIEIPRDKLYNLKSKIDSNYEIQNLKLKNIDIKTDDLKINNLTIEGDIKIESSSSDIEFQKINAKNLKIRTYSGDLNLEELNIQENLEIKTSSGDIKVSGINENKLKRIELESSSGNIDVNNFKSENIILESSSGNILLDNLESNNLNSKQYSGDFISKNTNIKYKKIETSSGDINIQSQTIFDLDLNTLSGNINLEISKNNSFKLDFITDIGNFKSKYPLTIEFNGNNNNNYDKDVSGTYNQGKYNWKIKSSSGNLEIN